MLVLVIAVASLDFLAGRAFRFKKAAHNTTPAKAGILFEEIRFPTRNGRGLYG